MPQAARQVRAAELEIKPYHIAGNKDLCEVSLARIMLTASLATGSLSVDWSLVGTVTLDSLTHWPAVNDPACLWADSEAGTREY